MSDKINYFACLGLNENARISKNDLDEALCKIQLQTHPDVLSQSSNQQQSIDLSNAANQAYMILKNPLNRIEHILDIHDIPTSYVDAKLLSEIMNIREEELPINEVKAIYDELLSSLLIDLDSCLYDNAAPKYLKLKFIYKLLQELEA